MKILTLLTTALLIGNVLNLTARPNANFGEALTGMVNYT